MKYVLSWIAGAIAGAVLFLILLYYNPFSERANISPLAFSQQGLIDLSFSTVPSEAIAFTNNGDSRVEPYPQQIAKLWEPSIRKTTIFVTHLENSRGDTEGVGIKFASESEQTRLLTGDALLDSVWHIYLPERGSLFIDQTENMWSYIRNIVLPARWNSADSWRGTWYGITTAGPNPLGTARVSGASGRFAGTTTEAIEALSARAYSAQQGPISITGNLTIAVAEPAAE
jgi:hypothetical protein